MANPYGFDTRPDMVPFVPLSGRLLEIGCSSGGFAYSLRQAGYDGEMWGLEPEPEAADEARSQFDHVITGFFPADIPSGELFDTVVFNDVLEHLVDPWEALRATRGVLTPDGKVVASIPNIRYWPVLRDLAFRGRWTYTQRLARCDRHAPQVLHPRDHRGDVRRGRVSGGGAGADKRAADQGRAPALRQPSAGRRSGAAVRHRCQPYVTIHLDAVIVSAASHWP